MYSEDADGFCVQIDGLAIWPWPKQVAVDGQRIRLTPTEFGILWLLVENRGVAFSREQILHRVHGPRAAATARTIDVQIVSLRRKLGVAGKAIETVRGVGYRFRPA